MFLTKNGLLNWFSNDFFFEKIRLIFDIENWLWKYNFGTFWRTVIHRWIKKNPLSTYVDSCPKILLFRTHHLWNSTTKLILNLIYILTLGYTIEHNWTRQIRWSLEGWMAGRIRCCENLQFNWREILVSRSGNFPNRNVTSRKYFGFHSCW